MHERPGAAAKAGLFPTLLFEHMEFKSINKWGVDCVSRSIIGCFMMLLVLFSPASSIAETKNNYLEQGIHSYEYGDYDNSIKSLQQINTISETTKTDALVHLYLALDYYAKGMNNDMKKELKALYLTEPDFVMNPVMVPPTVISAYTETKKHTIVALQSLPKPKEHSYWLRLVPFGVGQFSKGDDRKGTILLIAEATELAVNISTYYIRKSKENNDGSYNNPIWANNMQAVQLTAFWLLAGTVSYGIVDAFVWRMP